MALAAGTVGNASGLALLAHVKKIDLSRHSKMKERRKISAKSVGLAPGMHRSSRSLCYEYISLALSLSFPREGELTWLPASPNLVRMRV